MALLGDVTTNMGVTLNYHIIDRYIWDKFEKNITATVASYVNKNNRDNGKEAVLKSNYFFLIDPLNYGITVSDIYDLLKLSSPFDTMTSDN